MKKSSYIATTDGQGVTAVQTYWRLTGTINQIKLSRAWLDAGLPEEELVKPQEAKTALRKAVKKLERGRKNTLIVRRMKQKKNTWAIVDEQEQSKMEYDHFAEVRLTAEDDVEVTFLDSIDRPELRREIMRNFDAQQFQLGSEVISSWLTKLVHRFDAVSCRDGGGIYFVPINHADAWRTRVEVIEDVSTHTVYELDVMHSEKAIKAILDSVRADAAVEAARLEREVAEGALKSKALRTRAHRVKELEAKVERYEELLGVEMTALTESLGNLAGVIVAAQLAAEADEDSE